MLPSQYNVHLNGVFANDELVAYVGTRHNNAGTITLILVTHAVDEPNKEAWQEFSLLELESSSSVCNDDEDCLALGTTGEIEDVWIKGQTLMAVGWYWNSGIKPLLFMRSFKP